MPTRTVIEIDEDKCDGCGLCATGCHEGALRIIDGKARLVGESLCDGLGACIGECPRGALRTVVRDVEDYDERKVIEHILPKGMATVAAHLDHLAGHGQDLWYGQAIAYLADKGIALPVGDSTSSRAPAAPSRTTARPAATSANQSGGARFSPIGAAAPQAGAARNVDNCMSGGCPGSAARSFGPAPAAHGSAGPGAPQGSGARPGALGGSSASRLEHWPVQLHLANPRAPHFAGADLLIAADCTAFACGAFHQALLAGKKLVIACPKLDSGKEIYVDKLRAFVDSAGVRSITLAIMEVPCCGGLSRLLDEALAGASRSVPVSTVVVGIEGGSLTWL